MRIAKQNTRRSDGVLAGHALTDAKSDWCTSSVMYGLTAPVIELLGICALHNLPFVKWYVRLTIEQPGYLNPIGFASAGLCTVGVRSGDLCRACSQSLRVGIKKVVYDEGGNFNGAPVGRVGYAPAKSGLATLG